MNKTVRLILCAAMALPAFAVDLPSTSVAVEYIQGNGTDAYISTGWTLNPQTDRIQIEFAVTDEKANETLFCARGASMTDRAYAAFLLGAENKIRWDYSAASVSALQDNPLRAGVKYTLTAANDGLSIDNGYRYDHAKSASFTATGSTLQLFCALLTSDLKRTSFSTARIYSFKYWSNGELIHDCIPYRNNTNSEVGFWDLVEGKSLPSSGYLQAGPDLVKDVTIRLPDQDVTGTVADFEPRLEVRNANGQLLTPVEDYTVDYVPGPKDGQMRAHVTCLQGSGAVGVTNVFYSVRRPVPSTYERLEYIQGDGASWMLTDYVPNPQTDVLSLDFSMPTVDTTAFLCARANNGGSTWSFCSIGSTWRFDYVNAGTQKTPASRIVPDKTYTVVLSNNLATVSCNFSSVATLNTGLTSTVNPLMFYAFYVSGPNSGQRNTVSKHKTYDCRAWRNGALIHEWVPVRRVSDQKAMLFDTMTQQAVTPLGTGAFIAGPVLPSTQKAVTVADIPVQELAGDAVTPVLDIRDASTGVALVAGTDYTVAYADNTAVGTATATVTGLGAYADVSLAVPFTILHPLPAGYERLAYIQGDGKSYLLTDWIVHAKEDRVDAEIELTQEKVNAVIFCTRAGMGEQSFTLFQLQGGNFRWDYSGMIRNFTTGAALQKGIRYPIRITNCGELYWGDRVCATAPKTYTFAEAVDPLMLFASYYNGSANNIAYFSTHRLYGMSIRREGVPGRAWVPVKDASGVATLYDVVSGTRLTPMGTGAFIAGPRPAEFDLFVRDQTWDGEKRIRPQVTATNRVTGAGLAYGSEFSPVVTTDTSTGVGLVTATGTTGSAYEGQFANASFAIHAALPEGYTRLRYVQDEGKSHIPTGLVPHPQTDRLQMDFEVLDGQMSGLFCARGSNYMDRAWAFCMLPNPTRFRFDFATSNQVFTGYGPVLPNRRYVVDVNRRTCTVSSGETISVGGSENPTEAGGPLMLLCYYTLNNGTPQVASRARARLFGVKMSRSGTLLHDWVPVLTPDGVATLFDLVDKTELVPEGNALTAGPLVEYDPPAPARTLILVR